MKLTFYCVYLRSYSTSPLCSAFLYSASLLADYPRNTMLTCATYTYITLTVPLLLLLELLPYSVHTRAVKWKTVRVLLRDPSPHCTFFPISYTLLVNFNLRQYLLELSFSFSFFSYPLFNFLLFLFFFFVPFLRFVLSQIFNHIFLEIRKCYFFTLQLVSHIILTQYEFIDIHFLVIPTWVFFSFSLNKIYYLVLVTIFCYIWFC